jgi:predicted phosphodiesterase
MTNTPTDQTTTKVLLAGDTHGDVATLQDLFAKASEVGATAIVQCGDFGFGWRWTPDEECWFSSMTSYFAEQYGIDFYWIDGNHENYDALYALPLDENGHRPIAPRVTHLPRGSTLTLGNTKFRAFGGAYSTDVEYRTEGKSWWEQETITDEDVEKAIAAGSADVFLSHDAPTGVVETAGLRRKLVEWGPMHAEKSRLNQNRVRKALLASGAKLAFHGHLHQAYQCVLDGDSDIIVRGLDRDGTINNDFVLEV